MVFEDDEARSPPKRRRVVILPPKRQDNREDERDARASPPLSKTTTIPPDYHQPPSFQPIGADIPPPSSNSMGKEAEISGRGRRHKVETWGRIILIYSSRSL